MKEITDKFNMVNDCTINWTKVTTVEDIKKILESLEIRITPGSRAHESLKDYINK